MANEIRTLRAKQVYKTLCAALDERNWKYEQDEDELRVRFGVSGDDIPMEFIMFVDVDRQMVRLVSPLPFEMSEEKRIEGAAACCMASFGMVDGNFDYDLSDGSISFRMTESFNACELGEGVFQYLISCACAMVDEYNDKFLALDKGMISISDFVKS